MPRTSILLTTLMLAVLLGSGLPVDAVVIDQSPPYLYHDAVIVDARSMETITIVLREGDSIDITMYITSLAGEPIDIDISIIGPDGKVIQPTQRVEGIFRFSFSAYMSGRYLIQLDNRYSVFTDKLIDIAIAGYAKPEVKVETQTITTTATETVTEIQIKNITVTAPAELQNIRSSPSGFIILAIIFLVAALSFLLGRKS